MCPHCNHSADYRSYVRRDCREENGTEHMSLLQKNNSSAHMRLSNKTALCIFQLQAEHGLPGKPLTHTGSNLCFRIFAQLMQTEISGRVHSQKCSFYRNSSECRSCDHISSGVRLPAPVNGLFVRLLHFKSARLGVCTHFCLAASKSQISSLFLT